MSSKFKSWKKYLRRKLRKARKDHKFKDTKKDDIIDWGNGKSYKFDGHRWKKVEEADELEIAITNEASEVSEDVLPSSKAISDMKLSQEVEVAKVKKEAAEAVAAVNLTLNNHSHSYSEITSKPSVAHPKAIYVNTYDLGLWSAATAFNHAKSAAKCMAGDLLVVRHKYRTAHRGNGGTSYQYHSAYTRYVMSSSTSASYSF